MKLSRFLVSIIVFSLFLSGVSVISDCPPCDYYLPSMIGAGAGPNSTTLANVYIDDSWWVDSNGQPTSGTNSNIWNAVCAGTPGSGCENAQGPSALKMWNDTVGTINQHAPYSFRLNQSFTSHTDVYIKKGNPQGGCADTYYENGHYVITLANGVQNLPQQLLAALIAHELGHALGLNNYDESPDAECENTIMNGADNCEMVIAAVQQADIDAAYKAKNNRSGCDNAPSGGGESGGGENGGGGNNCTYGGEGIIAVENGYCEDYFLIKYWECSDGQHYTSEYQDSYCPGLDD